MQGTVMELESVHSVEDGRTGGRREEGRKDRRGSSTAELETAVLLQEMMAGREERADLRAQVGASLVKIPFTFTNFHFYLIVST